jgi:putative membrane protein
MVAMLALATVAPARTSPESTGSTDAKAFIKEAAVGGMAEVQLGKLAQERGSSQDVKDFGKRMVEDHTKVNQDLQALAAQKKVDVPTDVDAKHKATYDRLSKMSGEAFDRAYMQEMLNDHRSDVAAFKKASSSGDPDVQAFASRSLPTLEQHLSQAERVHGDVASTGMHRQREER